MPKRTKSKGEWLRKIEIVSETVPRPDTPEFAVWCLKHQREREHDRDLSRIMSEQRKAIEAYLPRIGFVPNDRGIYRKTVGGRVVWLSGAHDTDPIAHAGWRQLQSIKEVEAAIEKGDIRGGCMAAFMFGMALEEADALYAHNLSLGKKPGAHGALKDIYFDACTRLAACGILFPGLHAAKMEMRKDTARCRFEAGTYYYKTKRGGRKPFPRDLKGQASRWRRVLG